MSIEWRISDQEVDYPKALACMEQRVEQVQAGTHPELIWLLEHPPLYTAGVSARPEDMLDTGFPVYQTRRGGQYTYHGPGQRVAYTILDVGARGRDVRKFVWQLEEWIIQTLAVFDIRGERRKDRIGVWVAHDGTESKIAAVGIKLRKWVSFHGISINVNPDLTHFSGIIPCGIREYGVTSLAKLSCGATLTQVDNALQKTFRNVF